MTAADPTITTVPTGYSSVSPWLITRDTNALFEFITAAFGAEEIDRVVGADGSIGHAEARIGDSVVLAFDSRPHWPATPSYLRLYTHDADAAFHAALAAGATTVSVPDNSAWGDRGACIQDPLGNIWWIMSHMEDVSDGVSHIPAGYRSVEPWIITSSTPELLDFITAAFAAQEAFRVPMDDASIGHAEARIGDSNILAFDSRPGWPPTPAFLRVYVDDGDATFAAALAAGATPVTDMTEMFWGEEVGRVRDPLGNLWWIHCRVAELSEEEAYARAGDPKFVKAMEYVSGVDFFARGQLSAVRRPQSAESQPLGAEVCARTYFQKSL